MSNKPLIAVVILNYKSAELTINCVTSVMKSTYKNICIYVLDNGSEDLLEEKIKDFKYINFIQNKKNLGFAGGNNVGIRKALEDGAEYVFILNPDTTVEKDTIEKLLKGEMKYRAGIVCPKIYFSNSKIIWFAGKVLDLDNVLGNHIGVNEDDRGQFDKDSVINDATGAAMLIRRDVFTKIGLFDERFFLYYEDSDFSYRAIQAGYKIMYIYSAVVYHKNAQSTGLGSPLQDYYITRNRLLFAAKFLSFRTRFALFREALRNFNNPIRKKAFFDFLMGRFGKGEY